MNLLKMNDFMRKIIDFLNKYTKVDVMYFLRNGTWSLIGDGVQVFAGAVLAVLFARLASKEVFGQFQFILSIVSLLAVVSVKGLDVVVLRDTARGFEGVYRRAVKLRFWWSLLGIPIMLIVGWYYRWAGDGVLASAFVIGAWLMPMHYASNSWTSWLKGKKNFNLLARYTAVKSVLNTAVVMVAIVLSAGSLVVVFVSYFVGQIVMNSIAFVISRKLAKNDQVSSDWKQYSYFVSLAGLFKLVMVNIDKVLVAVLISPTALAVYTVAILIPNYFQLVVKSLFQTAAPRLSKRKYVSFNELGIIFVIGIVFTVVNLVLIRLLLVPLFGESYREALSLAYIASLGMLMHPMAQYLVNFANMSAKKRVILIGNIVAPAIKLVLFAVFVSLWKEVGFVIVYAVMAFVWVVVPLSILKIDWHRRLIG